MSLFLILMSFLNLFYLFYQYTKPYIVALAFPALTLRSSLNEKKKLVGSLTSSSKLISAFVQNTSPFLEKIL